MRQQGIACALMALGLFLLIDGPGSAQPTQLGTSISANRATFKSGDPLTMAVGVTNPGPAAAVDSYFGALPPDGTTVADFTDPQLHVAIVSLSGVAALRPMVAGVTLPGGFTVNNVTLFGYTWSGTEPLGRYVFFFAAARSGAPLPGSLLALSTAELTRESAALSSRSTLQFDGLTNYVEVPTSPDLSVSAAGLTVAAWMRPDTLTFPKTEGSLPAEQYVHWLGKGQMFGPAGQQEWVFRMYSNPTDPRANRVSFYVFNPAGGRGCGSYFQDPLQAGQWIHVAGVANATTQQTSIYKNGALRNTTSFGGIITPTPGTAPLRMGTQNFASFLEGALGPIRVWNRPLTAGEVHDLYTANVVPPNGLVAEYLLNEGAGPTAHDTSGHAHTYSPRDGLDSCARPRWEDHSPSDLKERARRGFTL